ncbi:MAG: hypothetical protein AB7F40_02845 [Victivallaceae bacterium]|nr:hypothetical protein [Victivallaceae bacterium]
MFGAICIVLALGWLFFVRRKSAWIYCALVDAALCAVIGFWLFYEYVAPNYVLGQYLSRAYQGVVMKLEFAEPLRDWLDTHTSDADVEAFREVRPTFNMIGINPDAAAPKDIAGYVKPYDADCGFWVIRRDGTFERSNHMPSGEFK